MNDQKTDLGLSLRNDTNTYIHKRGEYARIDKARTDKDVIITFLNIDQLKLEIYGSSTKKRTSQSVSIGESE